MVTHLWHLLRWGDDLLFKWCLCGIQKCIGIHVPTWEPLSPSCKCMFKCFHTFPMSHMGTKFRVGSPWPLKKTHVSFYLDVGKPTSFHFCRFKQCRFSFDWHRFWNFHFKKKPKRKIVIFSLHATFCQKVPLKMRILKMKLFGSSNTRFFFHSQK